MPALALAGITAIGALAAIAADAPPPRSAAQAAPASGTARVSPVTDAMLAKPPAADWLMWRGTLNSWG